MTNSVEEEEVKRFQLTRGSCKKLKLSSATPPPHGLISLPDDIALNCLARVSRLDHPSLSVVTKSHRSLVLSPELYKVRSLIGRTENLIFLCLSIPGDPFMRWFAFSPRNRNHPCRVVPIRPHLYQPTDSSSIVAHGYGIYIIGGNIGWRRSTRVLFLDCRTHTWRNLPSMGVDRASAAAGVVDGKIYVFGGCGDDPKTSKWGEVFDIKTETWDVLSMPPDQYRVKDPIMCDSVVVVEEKENKVFGLSTTGAGLFYLPSQGIWKTGKSDLFEDSFGWYMIENVLYCCAIDGNIMWCDSSELEKQRDSHNNTMEWRQVMGLEEYRDILCASKLVNYGGWMSDDWEGYRDGVDSCKEFRNKGIDDVFPGHKLSNSGPNMLLFWDTIVYPGKTEIWCAEISLKRRKGTNEIWGNVRWSQPVMTFDNPKHCKLLYSLSLNL